MSLTCRIVTVFFGRNEPLNAARYCSFNICRSTPRAVARCENIQCACSLMSSSDSVEKGKKTESPDCFHNKTPGQSVGAAKAVRNAGKTFVNENTFSGGSSVVGYFESGPYFCLKEQP